MFSKYLALLALTASQAAATIYYAGVNQAGGESGVRGSKGHGLPGRYKVDYAFVNTTTIPTWGEYPLLLF